MLRDLIRSEQVKNAIIFCNRKRDVAILLKSLQKHGFNAGALHGDMDQMSRTATLDAFREGRISLLAASDVAARGLDIPDVSHIFNFDVPWQADDYVHRIGRTGRAGKEGRSLTIVTVDDIKQLKDIEKMLGAPSPGSASRPASRTSPKAAASGAAAAVAAPARSCGPRWQAGERGAPRPASAGARAGRARATPRPGRRQGRRPRSRAPQGSSGQCEQARAASRHAAAARRGAGTAEAHRRGGASGRRQAAASASGAQAAAPALGAARAAPRPRGPHAHPGRPRRSRAGVPAPASTAEPLGKVGCNRAAARLHRCRPSAGAFGWDRCNAAAPRCTLRRHDPPQELARCVAALSRRAWSLAPRTKRAPRPM